MTIRNAASTRRISSKLRYPMLSPSRPGSTAAVCSASTRVTRPATSTSGRKLATRAVVDVGATSKVDRGSSSDWMTTAYGCRTAHGRDCPVGARVGRFHHARSISMSRSTCAASARSASSAAVPRPRRELRRRLFVVQRRSARSERPLIPECRHESTQLTHSMCLRRVEM